MNVWQHHVNGNVNGNCFDCKFSDIAKASVKCASIFGAVGKGMCRCALGDWKKCISVVSERFLV